MSDKFYVYEHWRPDRNEPFWVGKGQGGRAQYFERGSNFHYNRIVAKLTRLGMCVEVRMVESGMPEREAFALETVRILYWRSRGIKLANLTDGGEGLSNPSPEVRAKISAANLGKVASAETRAKIGAIHRGRIHSPEERVKRSASLKGRIIKPEHRAKLSAVRMGITFSPETRAKMSAAAKISLKGHVCSAETRAKISAANRLALKGHKHTAETLAKMRAAHQGQVCSPETRAKLSARIVTPEWRAKISAAKKGKPKSMEHREKLRIANLGKKRKKEVLV